MNLKLDCVYIDAIHDAENIIIDIFGWIHSIEDDGVLCGHDYAKSYLDMAKAIDWAIKRDFIDEGAFLAVNVGSSEWNYQVKDLAEAVAKVIPGVEISINKNAQHDKRSYQVSFEFFKNSQYR